MSKKKKKQKNKGIFCNFSLVQEMLKSTTMTALCEKIAGEEDNIKYKNMYLDFAKLDWNKMSFNQKKCICTGLRFKLGITEAYSSKMDRARHYDNEINQGFHRAMNNHKYL